jgi:WD40 repeat protein
MKSPSSGSLVPCYHPTQDILGSTTSGLRLWDLYTSTPITRNLELIGHRQRNTPVFFSPEGSRLYSVGDKVTILNLQYLATTIPADDVLEAWAKLLSGKQVDTLGGLVDLSTAEIEAVWKVIEPAVRSKVIP